MPNIHQTFRVDPSIIAQSVGSETVLLDMRTELYLGLNSIGAVIWEALEKGVPTEQICDRLTSKHPELPPQTIRNDVENLIAKLLEKELIHLDP